MPFDLIAFYENQDASSGLLMSAVNTGESIYRTKDDDIIVKKRAPLLGALTQLVASTPGVVEIRQPSLKIPYTFIRGEDHNSSRPDEGHYHFWDRPLPLYPGEKLNCHILQATSEISWVVLALLSQKCTRSQMENVNPTHRIWAYSDTDAVADAWTLCELTYSHSLPKGRYAIVGMVGGTMKASGPTMAAMRLVIPDTTWRPGVMAGICDADNSQFKNLGYRWDLGQLWPLMPEIAFEHDDMPNIEILAGAANENHFLELVLQKIA